ncbi:hypothetical protein EJB05_43587, partial [Eragrostis curvula]
RLPPEPWELPVIGSMHHLVNVLPHRALRDLAALLAGEIVGYEWVDILFVPSGDYWRKLRQLCAAEILSPKRALSFRHIREDEV